MSSSSCCTDRFSVSTPVASSGFSAEVFSLIARLDDLHDAPGTVFQLIRLGGASIPSLADALLQGRPRSVPQPRCCLVQVLAALRAEDILLEYLQQKKAIADPQIRFSEDTVINAAARALKGTYSTEAFSALLDLAQQRCLSGVIEALAEYRRTESVPCFIRALESDLARQAAVDALRTFGEKAKEHLLAGALRREPRSPDRECASSLSRRRACLKLLEPLRLSDLDQDCLSNLLFEADAEIVMSVGAILLSSNRAEWRATAFRRLQGLFPHIEWWLRDELTELTRRFEAPTKTYDHSDCFRFTRQF